MVPRTSGDEAESRRDGSASAVAPVPARMEVVTGDIAAGGGCVARADDGRVMFVRHALPGERVVAEVTSEATSFVRADAVQVLEPSPDRVPPPCPLSGPGRCGGCDWQHVSLPGQRSLKGSLVAEQLRRLAGVHRTVEVEEVPGAPDGLGWRTRVRFAVDRTGRVGLHRHRSRDIQPVEHCPLASQAVADTGVGTARWVGAHHVEVLASPDGGRPVVAVETGRRALADTPQVAAGLVVNGRTRRRPDRIQVRVGQERFQISSGVFWQVHPGAASVLTRCVLEGLAPRPGDRVADLYAGAGLFTVPLARAVGPRGSVVAVERSDRACRDAMRNARDQYQVELIRSDVRPEVVADLGAPDLVLLDPARQGAGRAVMEALVLLAPRPRAIVYVSCDPASFARDLSVVLEAGWSLGSLRAFDLFPMTEHVELVSVLQPPVTSEPS